MFKIHYLHLTELCFYLYAHLIPVGSFFFYFFFIIIIIIITLLQVKNKKEKENYTE